MTTKPRSLSSPITDSPASVADSGDISASDTALSDIFKQVVHLERLNQGVLAGQARADATGFRDGYTENLLRTVDLPIFEGKLVYYWLAKVERYFRLQGSTEKEKLELISVSLVGEALSWVNQELNKQPFQHWHQFVDAVLLRFGDVFIPIPLPNSDPTIINKRLPENIQHVNRTIVDNLQEELLQTVEDVEEITSDGFEESFSPTKDKVKQSMDIVGAAKLWGTCHPLSHYFVLALERVSNKWYTAVTVEIPVDAQAVHVLDKLYDLLLHRGQQLLFCLLQT